MSKLITDYLKRSCSTPLSSEEPFSLSTAEASPSQRTGSDVQTSRRIRINKEKSTNKNNESIPVLFQPGPDYLFPMKQFGKKKRSCQVSWFKNFSWLHYSKEKYFCIFVYFCKVFCIFSIRHKGKLTAEHNMVEAYIIKGFNNWKKALEAFVDHQQSKAHRAATTYESVMPQCGDVLEITVNDLNNKRLAERNI